MPVVHVAAFNWFLFDFISGNLCLFHFVSFCFVLFLILLKQDIFVPLIQLSITSVLSKVEKILAAILYCFFFPHLTLPRCNSLCASQPRSRDLQWNQCWIDEIQGIPEVGFKQRLRLTHPYSAVIQVANRHSCSAALSNNNNVYFCLSDFPLQPEMLRKSHPAPMYW